MSTPAERQCRPSPPAISLLPMSAKDSPPFPRPGSSLALAIVSAGPRRDRLMNWVCWWHEVSRIPYDVSDAAIGEKKLIWWMQAVRDAQSKPPQHPLLRAVMGPNPATASDGSPPEALWMGQLQGLQTLLQQTRWLDTAGLEQHMQQTTGLACEGAAWVLGARTPRTLACAQRLGVALRKAHILARIGQDTHAGWLHLPVDTLQRHGVKAHEWMKPSPDAPTSAMLALMREWQSETLQALSTCLIELKAAPPAERGALRPLRVMAALNLQLLQDLDAHGYQILKQRISVGPWRKWLRAALTR